MHLYTVPFEYTVTYTVDPSMQLGTVASKYNAHTYAEWSKVRLTFACNIVSEY